MYWLTSFHQHLVRSVHVLDLTGYLGFTEKEIASLSNIALLDMIIDRIAQHVQIISRLT